MTNKQFFNKDLIINWRKVYCQFCGEPTGPSAQCYRNQDINNIPITKRKILTQAGPLPILSPACIYRKENAWEAEINYPVSEPLIKRLAKLDGVDRIMPSRPYNFIIVIGGAFDERSVKKAIRMSLCSFVRELQITERNLLQNKGKEADAKNLIGLSFPNGQQFLINSDESSNNVLQTSILKELANNLPETKIIEERDK